MGLRTGRLEEERALYFVCMGVLFGGTVWQSWECSKDSEIPTQGNNRKDTAGELVRGAKQCLE